MRLSTSLKPMVIVYFFRSGRLQEKSGGWCNADHIAQGSLGLLSVPCRR